MNQIATQLPTPSDKHATCAWCRKHFDTIVELIDHVDNGHLDTTDVRPHARGRTAASAPPLRSALPSNVEIVRTACRTSTTPR